jgi:hypothetical protein
VVDAARIGVDVVVVVDNVARVGKDVAVPTAREIEDRGGIAVDIAGPDAVIVDLRQAVGPTAIRDYIAVPKAGAEVEDDVVVALHIAGPGGAVQVNNLAIISQHISIPGRSAAIVVDVAEEVGDNIARPGAIVTHISGINDGADPGGSNIIVDGGGIAQHVARPYARRVVVDGSGIAGDICIIKDVIVECAGIGQIIVDGAVIDKVAVVDERAGGSNRQRGAIGDIERSARRNIGRCERGDVRRRGGADGEFAGIDPQAAEGNVAA